MKIKVAILGGSGYTGVELLRILSNHPYCEVVSVTSRKMAGKKVCDVFPSLIGYSDLEFVAPSVDNLSKDAEYVFTCVPHQTAMEVVPSLLDEGLKVIDLSADFRIRDKDVYERWYQRHACPQYLKEAVYGLPELYRDAISSARLVANPGCYPTSAILPLVPLLAKGLIEPETIIVDSKSGTSGAGRGANVATLFCEVNEGFKAYKIAKHRHTPEIEQELGVAAGKKIRINFTPHLVPMSRGILTTIYANTSGQVGEKDLRGILRSFYENTFFVKVLPEGVFPNVLSVRGTNMCHIGLRLDERTGRVILISAIDNLCKGASGQAVQNMNIMAGFKEEVGLDRPALYP